MKFLFPILIMMFFFVTIIEYQLYCLFHPQPYILLVGRAAALFQSNPASIKLLLLESISNMDDTQCLSFLADTKRNMKAR